MKKFYLIVALWFAIANHCFSQNLLVNPGAESSYDGWTKTDGGSGWGVVGGAFSGDNCWASSFANCTLSQTVSLLDKGYTATQLDAQPVISAGVYVKGNWIKKGIYSVRVELLDVSDAVLFTQNIAKDAIVLANAPWVLKAAYLKNYGIGVRKVRLTFTGNQNDGFGWGGQYGPVFDNAFVEVESGLNAKIASISDVTMTSAIITGSIRNPSGNATTVSMEYGTTESLGSTVATTPISVSGTETNQVSAALTDLESGTTYFYRVSATDGTLTATSEMLKFTTVTPLLTVSSSEIILDCNSVSKGSFNISSNVDWSINGSADWLSVSATYGSNNATIALTTSSVNATTSSRSVELTLSASGVADVVVTVIQNGAMFTEVGEDGLTYYLISNVLQMSIFRDMVNGGQTAINGKLTNDIDLAGSAMNQWIPIGTTNNTNEFGGVFDGNDHTISRLYLDDQTNDNALFGYLATTGTVKKLTVSGDVSGTNYSAGIVARNSGLVENCVNQVSVTASGWDAGGIASLNFGEISQCSNEAVVKGSTDYVGGIAGYCSVGKIENCVNSGEVTYNGTENNSKYVGGIVGGVLEGSVDNCKNSALVTGGQYVGGIAGLVVLSSIANCYSIGDVSSIASSANGSLVGELSKDSEKGRVINCYYLSSSVLTENGDKVDLVAVGSIGEPNWAVPSKPVAGLKSISSEEEYVIAYPKTSEAFNSGEVAYGLGNSVWGQTIGTDDYPLFLAGENKVNKITYIGDYTGVQYANTEVELPVCPEAGYTYYFSVDGVEFDGANIASDLNVTVEKKSATSIINDREQEVIVYVADKVIVVDNVIGQSVSVYDMQGRCVFDGGVRTSSQVKVPVAYPGIYLVKANDRVEKVSVK